MTRIVTAIVQICLHWMRRVVLMEENHTEKGKHYFGEEKIEYLIFSRYKENPKHLSHKRQNKV